MISFIAYLALGRALLIVIHAMRAMDYVYNQPNWRDLKDQVNASKVFLPQLVSLHKWTYKQFYPEFR